MSKVQTDIGLLVLRLGAGLFMAFGHGFGKIPPSDGFIGGVEKLGLPMPIFFAWMAAFSALPPIVNSKLRAFLRVVKSKSSAETLKCTVSLPSPTKVAG